jgi:hypothetical protein
MWAPPSVEGVGAGEAGGARALEAAFPLDVGPVAATWTHRFTHRIWSATAYRCELRGEIEGGRFAAELDGVPTAFRPALEP